MAPNKHSRHSQSKRLTSKLLRMATETASRGRLPLVAIALLAALGGGLYVVRQYIVPSIAVRDEYHLAADRIHITPRPDWITTDVKKEVLREGSLDRGLSVLDEDLSQRLIDAFEMHPWVKSVDRVEKTVPAGVDVAITYRHPIAAVVVSSGDNTLLSPVDSDGVRLAARGMQRSRIRTLPRIHGPTDQPLIGQAWRDRRVLEGCRLAAYLAESWGNLCLVDIVPSEQEAHQQKSYFVFELITRGGTRIVWGPAPDIGPPDEPSPEAKLARLRGYIAEHGPLNDVNSPAEVDIRQGSPPKTLPRTARRNEDTKKPADKR